MAWIENVRRKPKVTGQYNVITNFGKSVAFWTKAKGGKKKWLCVNEDYSVIEWEEI